MRHPFRQRFPRSRSCPRAQRWRPRLPISPPTARGRRPTSGPSFISRRPWPGGAVAQVTENVYDSVTGDRLLIPQGARLLGAYDAATNHGDRRLLIVWSRLIMPNGWSIALRGMPGTDATGVSGVYDAVDAHLGRIAVASLLSGALSVAANEAEDDDSDRLSESVGNATAQEAARVGGRIVERELNVRPTLSIRAGAPVRVLVSQDTVLRPYPR